MQNIMLILGLYVPGWLWKQELKWKHHKMNRDENKE